VHLADVLIIRVVFGDLDELIERLVLFAVWEGDEG